MTARILVALVLSLAACAQAEQAAPTPAPAAPAQAPADTRWLTPEEPGYAQQVAWGLELPEAFAIVELSPEGVRSVCTKVNEPSADLVAGCAHGAQITIRDNLSDSERAAVLLHEMGHVLAHRHGHIVDPVGCPADEGGAYVMCAESDGTLQFPTPADFDFVLAGR